MNAPINAFAVPVVAYVVEATEYERGWGCRPDGQLVFRTEADADLFMKKVADERRYATEVPDEYNDYQKIGYKEVKPEVIDALSKETKRNFIWYTNSSQWKP